MCPRMTDAGSAVRLWERATGSAGSAVPLRVGARRAVNPLLRASDSAMRAASRCPARRPSRVLAGWPDRPRRLWIWRPGRWPSGGSARCCSATWSGSPTVRGAGPGGGPGVAVPLLRSGADHHQPVRGRGREVHRRCGDGDVGHPGGHRFRCRTGRTSRARPGLNGERAGSRDRDARADGAGGCGDRRGCRQPGRGR